VPRQSRADSTTLVSSTIRTAASAPPRAAHGIDLGLDLVFGDWCGTGCFQRGGDRQEPVHCSQAPGLGGEEIHEILDLPQALGRQGLGR
jgi:hypothetical protein